MSRGIKRRRSFVSRFRERCTLRAIRATKETRYDFMGTIYFVGHYFYRGKWNGQNCERVYGAALPPPRFQETSRRERMKFPRDGRGERDRNSKNERLLASAGRRRCLRQDRFCLAWPLICYQTAGTHNEPSGRLLELFSASVIVFLSISFFLLLLLSSFFLSFSLPATLLTGEKFCSEIWANARPQKQLVI